MMTKQKTPRWHQFKALTVVPVAALAVATFATPSAENAANGFDAATAAVAPADTTKVFTVVEQMPEFPGGIDQLKKFLSDNVKYPADAEKAKVEGRVVTTFVVERDGSIGETKIVRSVFPSLDEEALRVVSLMPKWKPSREKGKPVRVKYTIPITFKLQGEDAMPAQPGQQKPQHLPGTMTPTRETPTEVISKLNNPLFVIDGTEATEAEWKKLDPKDIEHITVLKNPNSTAEYGEKGKNGVVLVTLKKK